MVVRKRFGQHFLHDPAVIRRIIESMAPGAGERIVEVGPGRGALTWGLLERAKNLDVIEIDRDLAEAMKADPRGRGRLRVHAENVLDTDFVKLRGDGPPLRIVGNLPYNISTPLLFRLLSQRSAIADMHFMLQKEVVDRMAAASGGKEYGRLTVMLAAYAAVERLFDVGPGAFKPPPKVWSAVDTLASHSRTAVRHRQRCGAPDPGDRGVLSSPQDAAQRLEELPSRHRLRILRHRSGAPSRDARARGVRTTRGALLSKRRHSLTQSGRIVPHSVILRIGWPIIEKCWCCWICPRAARKCSTPPATSPRIRMPPSSRCTWWITCRSSPWAKP